MLPTLLSLALLAGPPQDETTSPLGTYLQDSTGVVHRLGQPGRHLAKPGEFRVAVVKPALGMGIAISPGVKFDDLRSDAVRRFDLALIRGDEDRDPASRITQGRDEMREAILVLGHFQPAFGRAFLALFRHDADRVRPVAQSDGLHLIGGRHLEVERDGKRLGQPLDVGVRDMAAVFAQMRRDPVRPRLLRSLRGPDRVGIVAAPGIPHGGDVIDVHT